MKRILIVCNSAGSSNVLKKMAMAAASQGEHILLLTLDAVSKRSCEDLTHDNLTLMDGSQSDIQSLQTRLEADTFKSAIFGTPSTGDDRCYQLANALRHKIEELYSYDDYLLEKEANHPYDQAQQNPALRASLTWLLPVAKSGANHNDIVVGHPEIYAATHEQLNPKELDATRTALGITEKLLFVSGSKFTDEDLALIKNLMAHAQPRDDIQIRIGVHPGHPDLQDYMQRLCALVASSRQIKILLPPSVKARLNLETLAPYSSCFYETEVNGDAATRASDFVAAAMPATLLNKAAIYGIPAYYDTATQKPLLEDYFRRIAQPKQQPRLFDKSNVAHFFEAHKQPAILPSELASEQDPIETIKDLLIAPDNKSR